MAPGPHEIFLSLILFTKTRLSRFLSSPDTIVNSHGCKFIADGACVARPRSLSRVSLSTGFSRKARVLLLSSITFKTSIIYALLYLENFVTAAFAACPVEFPQGNPIQQGLLLTPVKGQGGDRPAFKNLCCAPSVKRHPRPD